MQEFTMASKIGPVHCCKWEPQAEPVGVVQIIHGIKEHMGRYVRFAEFLAQNGYVVLGADHPGHGSGAAEDGTLGYMTGGWSQTVMNIRALFVSAKEEYPGLPYIMFGHSMGSFLLMTYLSVYSSDLDAAILSGSGWQAEGLLSAGRLLCRQQIAKLGEDANSPLIENLMFGAYNKHFEPVRTPHDWISRDTEAVDAYAADPLCGWPASIQMCLEMMRGIQRNQSKVNLKKMKKELPVFFLAGQDDPVGNYGNGVLKAVTAFQNAGMEDVLVELYPDMRHECHNEIGWQQVYDNILTWIVKKTQDI